MSNHHTASRTHKSARDRRDNLSSGSRSVASCTSVAEIVILVVIAVLLVVGALLTSGAPVASPSLSRLEVRSGDTLWTVAAAHPVEGLSTAQVADLVAARNGLSGGQLQPGQELLVPAQHAAQQLASR